MTIPEQLRKYLSWLRDHGIENDRPIEQHIIFIAAKKFEELEKTLEFYISPETPTDSVVSEVPKKIE